MMTKRRIIIISGVAVLTFILSYSSLRITGIIKKDISTNNYYSFQKDNYNSRNKFIYNKNNNVYNIIENKSSTNDKIQRDYGYYPNNFLSYQSNFTSSKYFIPEPTSTINTITELEEMFEEINNFRNEAQEQSYKWALDQIKNPNLSQRTQEVYRLRLIKSLHLAHQALEEKKYEEALRLYEEALNDPLATPVTKYITYDYLIYIARLTKDLQKYSKYLIEQSTLVEDENLEVLGIQKEKGVKKWAEEKVKLLLASKDPNVYNEILNERIKQSSLSGKSKELVALFLKEEIKKAQKNFYLDTLLE